MCIKRGAPRWSRCRRNTFCPAGTPGSSGETVATGTVRAQSKCEAPGANCGKGREIHEDFWKKKTHTHTPNSSIQNERCVDPGKKVLLKEPQVLMLNPLMLMDSAMLKPLLIRTNQGANQKAMLKLSIAALQPFKVSNGGSQEWISNMDGWANQRLSSKPCLIINGCIHIYI